MHAPTTTQGPLPHTVPDFWHMVLEQRCPAVIMLGTFAEQSGRGQITKCEPYFPQTLGQTATAGKLLVVVCDKHDTLCEECDVRMLRVIGPAADSAGLPEGHTVMHMHFHAWPDHGRPAGPAAVRAVCTQLDELLCREGCSRDQAGPVVVHCSAGIGRTGTFCAIDIFRTKLRRWALPGQPLPSAQSIDTALGVPYLVHKLRSQRMGMVQTEQQYQFIYATLLEEVLELFQLAAAAEAAAASGGGASAADGGAAAL